jgi:hypothetical protein
MDFGGEEQECLTVMVFRPDSRIGDRRKRRMVEFTGSMRVSVTRWRVCGLLAARKDIGKRSGVSRRHVAQLRFARGERAIVWLFSRSLCGRGCIKADDRRTMRGSAMKSA